MSFFSSCSSLLVLFSKIFLSGLFPQRPTEKIVHEAELDSLFSLIHPQDATLRALLPYSSPLVQAFIIEAKFHGNVRAQEFLGKVLAHYLEKMRSESTFLYSAQKIILIPLPLGEKRRKERGYNQVEEIAKYAQAQGATSPQGRTLEISLRPEILVRTRETAPQTSLGRAARLQNMQNAFYARLPADLAKRKSEGAKYTYILLDDVVTTGATLSAGRAALEKAGLQPVFTLALTY